MSETWPCTACFFVGYYRSCMVSEANHVTDVNEELIVAAVQILNPKPFDFQRIRGSDGLSAIG